MSIALPGRRAVSQPWLCGAQKSTRMTRRRCKRWPTRLRSSQLSVSGFRRFVRKTRRAVGARILARCSFLSLFQVAGTCNFIRTVGLSPAHSTALSWKDIPAWECSTETPGTRRAGDGDFWIPIPLERRSVGHSVRFSWPHSGPPTICKLREPSCAALTPKNGSTQDACSWMQEMNTIFRAHN